LIRIAYCHNTHTNCQLQPFRARWIFRGSTARNSGCIGFYTFRLKVFKSLCIKMIYPFVCWANIYGIRITFTSVLIKP
jgi:hypothetical protein